MGDGRAGLHTECLLLRVRGHPDPVRHTVEEVRDDILPGRRYAHKLSIRAAGARCDPLGRRMVASDPIYTGPWRGK